METTKIDPEQTQASSNHTAKNPLKQGQSESI